MVHLNLKPKLEASPSAVAAVLAAAQRAQERLPDASAPLAERLFALECAASAGKAAASLVVRYRPALRDVEWWLDEHWQPDVPHVVVLAQALSANHTLDLSTPPEWRDKLEAGLGVLERRHTKFGIGRDPALIAAVLRGVAAADMQAPRWLLDASEKALDEYAAVEAVVELADALSRHTAPANLMSKAANAAFGGADASDHDAAYARWWLAGRQPSIAKHAAPAAIADARLQALATADPFEAKAAAMLMEVSYRDAGQLIIGTSDEVADARSKADAYIRITRAVYRGLFLAALFVGVLLDLHGVAGALAPKGSVTVYEHLIVAVCFVALSYCITGTAETCYRALGKDSPRWVAPFQAIIGVIAAIIGAWTG